jgi:hypothetical protein
MCPACSFFTAATASPQGSKAMLSHMPSQTNRRLRAQRLAEPADIRPKDRFAEGQDLGGDMALEIYRRPCARL